MLSDAALSNAVGLELAYGQHKDRMPAHRQEATREAAMRGRT